MKDSKSQASRHHHSIRKLLWLCCTLALFTFCASFAGAEELHITSFHQLTPSQGWVVANNHLLVTDNAGTRWSDITPSAGQANIDGAFFLDPATGWTVLSTPGANPAIQVAHTTDGGAHWTTTGLTAANLQDGSGSGSIYGGIATISFADQEHGWILLRLASSANFSLGILLQTTDGGTTWNRLPNPPIADGLLSVTRTVGWLSGGPDGNQTFVTHDGGQTWNATSAPPPAVGALPIAKQPHLSEAARADLESKVRSIVPNATLVRAQLNSAGDGWVEAVAGDCAGFKTGCVQSGHLLAVHGGVATEISPPAAPQNGPSTSSTTISSGLPGFDKCAAGTVSQMSTWWTSSPYFDANIYIGGSTRACSQVNLNSSWVNSIFIQGWKLIPTWVGPQAPCGSISTKISTNTTTAFNQGVSEASSAVSAANGLGLTNSVIYYDMENYNSSDTTCHDAVDSFINGWVQGLHNSGFVAGVYGSATNANSGWATLANVPDDVWIAKWNGVESTTGLSPLPDTLWSNHQRIHQYQGGHNETWGGITFNIDNDFEDGRVASASTTDPQPPTGTQSCTAAVGPFVTSYCDAPTTTIICGGAIGSRNDFSGVPINWTFTNGSTVCDVVTYNFGYINTARTCSFYLYVPNGFATTTIQATLSNGAHVSFNENPVAGWQHWFDSTGITSLTFTDANGTINQDLGWGRTSTWSIERLCNF